MEDKTCLILLGPTAVGKTSAAIRLAKYFDTQIISADSRQCYKELNMGVAKPCNSDLQQVQHYFINSHSIQEEVNAKIFEQYALNAIEEIFRVNDVAVMVGGTGLYIKAFCEGLDSIPVTDPQTRKEIISKLEQSGLQWLQNEVKDHDPEYFAKGEIQNPQRLTRALEIKLSTGKSILEFKTKKKKNRSFGITKIGLEISKQQLHENINLRVDKMIAEGLVKEAEMLLPFRYLNALQTVGYSELFDHIEGKISLEEAIENIKLNTRHYAKRQMTWFRKDKEIRWFSNETDITEGFINSLKNNSKFSGL